LVAVNGVNSSGQYQYQIADRNGNFVDPTKIGVNEAGQNPTRVVSRWSAMLTLRYTF
jgi:hypothetical protein